LQSRLWELAADSNLESAVYKPVGNRLGVLTRAVLAAPVGWVVQPVRFVSCK
jgi:hypothetical protein